MGDCCNDLEYSEFENTYNPTARKVHHCSECQNDIYPGQKYFKATGKFDGEMYTYKRCDRCRELIDILDRTVGCFCFGYGLLFETIYCLEEKRRNLIQTSQDKTTYRDIIHE